MEYTAEQLKRAVQLGALGYGPAKCANVIEAANVDDFTNDFNNPGSEFAQAYQKGKDMADFAIDAKLFELAKGGDLNALQELNKRRTKAEDETRQRQQELLLKKAMEVKKVPFKIEER